MVSRIGAEEEIPDNVHGILVLAPEHVYPDVLAHVSVRARNLII